MSLYLRPSEYVECEEPVDLSTTNGNMTRAESGKFGCTQEQVRIKKKLFLVRAVWEKRKKEPLFSLDSFPVFLIHAHTCVLAVP